MAVDFNYFSKSKKKLVSVKQNFFFYCLELIQIYSHRLIYYLLCQKFELMRFIIVEKSWGNLIYLILFILLAVRIDTRP